MRKNSITVILLVICLISTGLQMPVFSQSTSVSSGSVTFNADNSDGDNSDKFLIGAAITVVAVLLIVGWKMDRKRTRYADLQNSIDSAVVSNTLSNDFELENLNL